MPLTRSQSALIYQAHYEALLLYCEQEIKKIDIVLIDHIISAHLCWLIILLNFILCGLKIKLQNATF